MSPSPRARASEASATQVQPATKEAAVSSKVNTEHPPVGSSEPVKSWVQGSARNAPLSMAEAAGAPTSKTYAAPEFEVASAGPSP